jgi:hypothetical protein
MVSRDYSKYSRIIRWPDLRAVKVRDKERKWHFTGRFVSCGADKRFAVMLNEKRILKIWITRSLEDGKLTMLRRNCGEIESGDICPACAARVMKLLKWRKTEDGDLETEMQETRDEFEERDYRAKGLIE